MIAAINGRGPTRDGNGDRGTIGTDRRSISDDVVGNALT